jgi:hypothetical protein
MDIFSLMIIRSALLQTDTQNDSISGLVQRAGAAH